MTIVCPKCSSRLQVDETKAPTRPFTIRCPKCNCIVDSGSASPAVDHSGIAIGESPATGNPRFEQATPAPLFEIEQERKEATAGSPGTEKLVELLSGLLSQPAALSHKAQTARPSWDPRKVLVCVHQDNRELVARGLAENGYQVFVARDTGQAVERMRENVLDIVLLDSRFDPAEQGPVFISREVSILRPTQRRRLFFVLLSPSLRTLDAHTAFLNNANAIINVNDIGELPKLLENQVRAYNELYKDFNSALGLSAL